MVIIKKRTYLIQNNYIIVWNPIFGEEIPIDDYVLIGTTSFALNFQRRFHNIVSEQIMVNKSFERGGTTFWIRLDPQSTNILSNQIVLQIQASSN